jgi:hypothetical protein
MYTLCVEAPGWESCAGKQPGRHTKARLPAPNVSSAAEQKTPVAEPLKPTQSLPLKGVRDFVFETDLHECKTIFAFVLSSVEDKMQKNISLFVFCIRDEFP